MRWPDLADADRLLVVPTGSCEQHGPHLPLDTDTLLACAWADALAERRPDVLVAPPLTIGASGEHQSFPGTLSIGNGAMRDCALELARSALPQPGSSDPRPFSGVLFVNGHGGNAEALAAATGLLARESRAADVWHPRIADGDPHAGATETSLMLHLYPHDVHMELAEPGTDDGFGDIAETVRDRGLVAVTANGILGDPTTATATHGRELFDALTDDLMAAAESLVPNPQG